MEKIELSDKVNRLFDCLNDREKIIITETILNEKRNSQVAKHMRVSREYIRKVKLTAITKLRKRGITDEYKFRQFN